MNTVELKSDLHNIIDNINDTDMLSAFKSLFSQMIDNDIDWWDLLSETEKTLIEKGINQLDNREGISHSDVRKKVNLLFNKNA